jgi:hypothetical protein
MKSTNNVQTTEAVHEKAIAPTWQSHIVEELSDETQAAVSGGWRWRTISADPSKSITAEEYNKYAGFWGG